MKLSAVLASALPPPCSLPPQGPRLLFFSVLAYRFGLLLGCPWAAAMFCSRCVICDSTMTLSLGVMDCGIRPCFCWSSSIDRRCSTFQGKTRRLGPPSVMEMDDCVVHRPQLFCSRHAMSSLAGLHLAIRHVPLS